MTNSEHPCDHPGHSQFDFWLGEWDLSWPAEQSGGTAGQTARGTNRVDRKLGQCVIEERFSTRDGTFRGQSLSVFDSGSKLWRQTWVDNTGSYLTFAGGPDGNVMELRTEPTPSDGATSLNRMVFREIEVNSLLWEWQSSKDGGKSWTDLWTITYMRSEA